MPPATIRDEVWVNKEVAAEFGAEFDKEHLGVDEKATHKGLIEVYEAMIEPVIQISLADNTMVESSIGEVTPCTNAPIDGMTF